MAIVRNLSLRKARRWVPSNLQRVEESNLPILAGLWRALQLKPVPAAASPAPDRTTPGDCVLASAGQAQPGRCVRAGQGGPWGPRGSRTCASPRGLPGGKLKGERRKRGGIEREVRSGFVYEWGGGLEGEEISRA